MIKLLKKMIFTLCILAIPLIATAEAPAFEIVPKESSISFTATQNNAPVTGEFKTFTGELNVDFDKLDESHVKIIVDVNSVWDSYNQLSDTLKDKDWFNAKTFPQAVFTSKSFKKTGDKSYEAEGTLTIRDKTAPITLTLTQEENTQKEFRVKGSTTLKRTAFDVGQGEWADTKTIKDDVVVNFTITAVRK